MAKDPPSGFVAGLCLVVGAVGLVMLGGGAAVGLHHGLAWLSDGAWPGSSMAELLGALGMGVPRVALEGVQGLVEAAAGAPAWLFLLGGGWALATGAGLAVEALEKKAAAGLKAAAAAAR